MAGSVDVSQHPVQAPQPVVPYAARTYLTDLCLGCFSYLCVLDLCVVVVVNKDAVLLLLLLLLLPHQMWSMELSHCCCPMASTQEWYGVHRQPVHWSFMQGSVIPLFN